MVTLKNNGIRFIFLSLIIFMTSKSIFATNPDDTTYYYFSDGAVSMYETPWTDGHKSYQIFNWQGEKIYAIENVLQSYSVITGFTFHENGAINTAHTSTNPGASLYGYASVIRFDRSNIPTHRVDTKEPARSLDESMGETYLWQIEKGQWIKQEVIRCQPVHRPE